MAGLAVLRPGKDGKLKLSEKEASVIKRRIDTADQYSQKEFQRHADRALKLYKGVHYPNMDQTLNEPRVVVNYIVPMVETKVQSIAFNYPDFLLRPQDEEGEANSDVALPALTYEWRISGCQREAKRALRDRMIFGFGLVYTGWLFATTDGDRLEDGRRQVQGEPAEAQPDGTESETAVPQETVREDRFFVKRVNPRVFFVDPETDAVLENAVFCGYWELRPVDEVKGDDRFRNTRQIKGNTKPLKQYLSEELKGYTDEKLADQEPDILRVRLFHYYEKKRRIHCVFCDEHDKPLLIETWNWKSDHYPFVVLRGEGEEDVFWAFAPPTLVEHPQREINESRSQLSMWRRMSSPAYQLRQGRLSPKAAEVFRSATPGRLVEHDNPQPIEPIQHNPLQAEAFQSPQHALNDIQFISGLNEYETAAPPSKRMTKEEVQAIQSQGGARSLADRQAFEMFCSELGQRCLEWLQQYSIKTRTLPIYDQSTQGKLQGFRSYSAQDIQGQYHVEVYIGSTSAPNHSDDVKDIGFFLQSLAPLIQMIPAAQQVGVNLRPLLDQVMKSFPWIRHTDDILPPDQGQQVPQAPGMMPGAAPPGAPGAPPGGPPDPMQALAAMQAGLPGVGGALPGLPPQLAPIPGQ